MATLPEAALDGELSALEVASAPVDAVLDAFLTDQLKGLAEMDAALLGVGTQVAELVSAGGKRLRPAFVYWGQRAAGGAHDEAVFRPAAAVELLHTFALIHDDVMDRSRRRRGRPSVHEALAAEHGREGMVGDPDWFGVGGAILAGDLAFVWADALFDQAAVAPAVLARARKVFTLLRVEVTAGQFLDLRLAGLPEPARAEALHVALLKSGRYTVTRPLQLGAALGLPADPDPEAAARLDDALRGYGDALGVAFQLRDDVLGMFGDPAETGKSALDDLREGKRTVLMLTALERADAAAAAVLRSTLGQPDVDDEAAARVREIVVGCGALAEVEALVARRRAEALAELEAVHPDARGPLTELAELAAVRTT